MRADQPQTLTLADADAVISVTLAETGLELRCGAPADPPLAGPAVP